MIAMRSFLARMRRCLLLGALDGMDERRRRVLAWHAIVKTGVLSVVFERDGITWNVAPDDDVAFQLFVDGGYHIEEIAALLDWLRRRGALSGARDAIVDVGANIGSTCVPFVRAAGCRALALEPVGSSFRRLRINVEANGLGERIALVRRAVLAEPGNARMCLIKGASGGNFIWRDGLADLAPERVAGYEVVVGQPLSAILDSAGLGVEKIALVWADVQGCEAQVIETGENLWRQGVPLWAEIEPHSLALQGSETNFVERAARHFDRFLAARDLVRRGVKARERPIAELQPLMNELAAARVNTDVLLLSRHA